MRTAVRAALLALAVALAVTSPALAAGGLKKQRFQVTFKGENRQDWHVAPTDDETTPNCVLGVGADGSSELQAYTKTTKPITLYSYKKGSVFGRVPIEADLYRALTLGQRPPDDCLNRHYLDLVDRKDCEQVAQWGHWSYSPPAYLEIAAARGRVSIEVTRDEEAKLLDEVFPFCPSAGTEEGAIEGQKKLSGGRSIFDGKTHTAKGSYQQYFPAPTDHSVEGYSEWKVSLKAVKPARKH